MGIASRTKWEARATRKFDKVRYLNPAKLARAARLLRSRINDLAWAKMIRENFSRWHSEAVEALRERRLRRRKSAARRGFVPYAQR